MPTPSRAADGWRNGQSVGVSVRNTVTRSYIHTVIHSYGHTFIRSYRHTDGKGLFPDRRKAEQSFPFTKAKQARGFPSAARSGGYAVRGTISTLMLRVVFFP
ncbi:hypothetical protein [Bacteroides sp.]|uniref:hypothetical protein n=1 Tax=Bacteroides sp. TaxID=29523 RepID=UPI00290EFE37|nr:hypothetical protein [Bacteroides sp.]MDU7617639.1 hypothetical protein [Bacteroides sp.]